MGICKDCIYHSYDGETAETRKFHRPFMRHLLDKGHICLNPDNDEQNFITGEIYHANCYLKNNFEECLFFDDGKQDVTYYAWKTLEDDFIFTLTDTPDINDFIFNEKSLEAELPESIGVVEDNPMFYCWQNLAAEKDEENLVRNLSIIYTKTDEPIELVDKTYSVETNTEDLVITKVENGAITVLDKEYERYAEFDLLNILVVVDGKNYFRSPLNDIVKREPIPEPSEEENPDEDDNINEGNEEENNGGEGNGSNENTNSSNNDNSNTSNNDQTVDNSTNEPTNNEPSGNEPQGE